MERGIGCFNIIEGYVVDEETNFGYTGVKVETDKGHIAYTGENEFYTLFVEPNNYPDSIKINLDNYKYDAISPLETFYNNVTGVYEKSTDSLYQKNRILQTILLEEKDLSIRLSSGRNRPGFTIPYYVTVHNRGKENLKSNIQLDLSQELTYTSKDGEDTPSQITGNLLQWDSVLVKTGESVRLKVFVVLDRHTSNDTVIVSTASLDMNIPDNVTQNNLFNLHARVTGSFDPNDKLVSFQGAFTEGYVYDTTDFEYTIRFQNTGTDTAFTVRVQDVIDPDLDLSSLIMLDASHAYNMTIKNDTINWIFNDILLVDSTTNEPLSHGFINFRIKQKENNPLGTIITNQAEIYFDFNDPIITNETMSIVDNGIVTEIEENNHNKSLAIYPNPIEGRITIQTEEQGLFTLYNELGEQVLYSKKLKDIETQDLPSGVYFYEFRTTSNVYSGKILKK